MPAVVTEGGHMAVIYLSVLVMKRVVDVQKVVGAAIKQFVVDILEGGVILRDLEFAGLIIAPESLLTLSFALI